MLIYNPNPNNVPCVGTMCTHVLKLLKKHSITFLIRRRSVSVWVCWMPAGWNCRFPQTRRPNERTLWKLLMRQLVYFRALANASDFIHVMSLPFDGEMGEIVKMQCNTTNGDGVIVWLARTRRCTISFRPNKSSAYRSCRVVIVNFVHHLFFNICIIPLE